MGNPAARLFIDKVIGFPHCHMPGHPPGPPIPTPIVGLLLYPDPLSLIFGRPTVFINNLPAAELGDLGIHAFCCGPNRFEITTGSSTVNIEGERAVRIMDFTKHCEAGSPAIPPVIGNRGMVVSGSPNVLIGGIPLPDFTAIAIGLSFKGLAKLKDLTKAGKLGKKAQRGLEKASEKMHAAAKKIMDKVGLPNKYRDMVHSQICTLTGHPVDVASGKVFIFHKDIEISSRFPIIFQRTYKSSSDYNGPLGYGWHHNYDLELKLIIKDKEKYFIFKDEEGREIPISYVPIGKKYYDKLENIRVFNNNQTLEISKNNIAYIFEQKDGSYYRFIKISDNNGNEIKLKYSNDKVSEIIGVENKGIQLKYINNKISTISLITNNGILKEDYIEYNYKNDDLVSVVDVYRKPIKYVYKNHLIVSETNRAKNTYYFDYDTFDDNRSSYCTKTWSDNNFYRRDIYYDRPKRITTIKDSRGFKWIYKFNEFGVVHETTDPLGNISKILYNEDLKIIKEIYPSGKFKEYDYDEKGSVKSVKKFSGFKNEYTIDNNGNITKTIDPIGNIWEYDYDEKGNMIESKDPLMNKTTYYYNKNGTLDRKIDQNGYSTKFEYDEYGLVIKKIDSNQNVERFEYNEMGLINYRVDRNGNKFIYKRDDNGRIIGYYVDGSPRCLWEYDEIGRIIKEIDGLGNVTKYQYDILDLPIKIIYPDDRSISYSYDTEGNLTKITNENNQTANFIYDAKGRIKKKISFNRTFNEYRYDHDDNIIKIYDSNKDLFEYIYDLEGNILEEKINGGIVTRYQYNKNDLMIEAENNNTNLKFEYDQRNLLIKEKQGVFEVQYEYDKFGNKLRVKSNLGTDIQFKYNNLNLVEYIKIKDNIEEFFYDANYNLIKIKNSNNWSLTLNYDHKNRVIERRISKLDTNISSYNYEYNNNDSIILVKINNKDRIEYSYDSTDRIIKVLKNGLEKESYSYDNSNNILSLKSNKQILMCEIDKENRLIKDGNFSYFYDTKGNLVSKKNNFKNISYYYDQESQLIGIESNGSKVNYKYDPLGRRIEKTSNQERKQFLWDGDLLLSEINDDKRHDKTQIDYIFIPNSFNPLLYHEDDSIFYSYLDHLGLQNIISDNFGNFEMHSYSVYGLMDNNNKDTNAKFRFPGQYYDIESGLCYSRYRYYSSSEGRFITTDPTGLISGLNEYQYTSNPIKYSDPFGLAASSTSGNSPPTSMGNTIHYGGALTNHIANDPVLSQGKFVQTGRGFKGPDAILVPNPNGPILEMLDPETGRWHRIEYIELKPSGKSGEAKFNSQINNKWNNLTPPATLNNTLLVTYPAGTSNPNPQLTNARTCRAR